VNYGSVSVENKVIKFPKTGIRKEWDQEKLDLIEGLRFIRLHKKIPDKSYMVILLLLNYLKDEDIEQAIDKVLMSDHNNQGDRNGK
jgi:type III secretion system FlhB-like substrate exporter